MDEDGLTGSTETLNRDVTDGDPAGDAGRAG